MKKLHFIGRFGLKPDGSAPTAEITFYGIPSTVNLLDKVFMKHSIVCTKEHYQPKGNILRFDVDDVLDGFNVLRYPEEFTCRFILNPSDGETPQVEFIGRRETMNCLDEVLLNRGIISYKEWDFHSESIISLRFNIDDILSKSDLL